MRVELPCGHTVDDLHYDTVCYPAGHYPLGTSPRTYCKHHDLYHPECPRPGFTAEQMQQPVEL